MAKILVVEDSSIDRTLIGGLLAKEPSWEIEFANDGQEALDRIAPTSSDRFWPDVIVTDLQMPRVDGFELVRTVRDLYPEVPVVLITSLGSEGLAVQALRAGATSFSPKSMLRSDLVRTLRQVLKMTSHMRYAHNPDVHPASKQIAFVLENGYS